MAIKLFLTYVSKLIHSSHEAGGFSPKRLLHLISHWAENALRRWDMTRQKNFAARNGAELAKALDLPATAAHEWRIKSELTSALIVAVEKGNLTHAEVAKRAKTSRTRITSILNRNLQHVSSDLLIRILGALGYEVKLSISRNRIAA
jgi:predicted XRE-type DNA-binding protein